VCDLPQKVRINLHQVVNEKMEPTTEEIEVTADMLGEYELSTRVWPVILDAAVDVVRSKPSVLLKDEHSLFDCKIDGTQALCDLGSYIAKLSGEPMIATDLKPDDSDKIWKKIMLRAGGSDMMVSLWSTSGNRRIIKDYKEKDSTFTYYNSDAKETDIHKDDGMSMDRVREEDSYILYPKSML
jgi:hypothetical protein